MSWMFPINNRVVGVSWDSMSFQNINTTYEVEIPCGNHVGAFGTERRHDVHKGVDLYCPVGTEVFTVEVGKVVDIRWFTGEKANPEWHFWHNTMAISVEGESGVVVYGEIMVSEDIKVGDILEQGEKIGSVIRVLKKDKGRPTSMLHFALHQHGVLSNGRWDIDKPQPTGLIDPTNRLIASVWEDEFASNALKRLKK
jgi:murein DD-endopeptidase MepM/ murein hydrolase activator NlpD